jgi:HD superfamily phosphohydrolase
MSNTDSQASDTLHSEDDVEVSGSPHELELSIGQRVGDVYTILDSGDSQPTDDGTQLARPLGRGGSGTVYRALYRNMQVRAIKFLTLNYLSGETGKHPTDFQTNFERERVFLSTLAHGNIARLYDTGTYTDAEQTDWQYIVTDFINGKELQYVLEQPDIEPNQVFELISDVLRAIRYLHAIGVLHADIKNENIRCRTSPAGVEAVLLDLGTAHRVSATGSDQSQEPELPRTRARFITTRRIMHARHRQYFRHVVSDEDLQDLFPDHDTHSVGILLEELSKRPRIAQKLTTVIGRDGMNALRTMVAHIKSSPELKHYTSIAQVHDDWLKLRRTYLAPVGVPELSLAAEFKYSMPTASGRGVITPRLSRLVNHKLFQRLRRVPQLEMTLYKFPGATHTRLGHSTAVLRNTRYYLAHLLNDPNFRLSTEQSDLEATILLALLHDVGHYQLSHMFEDYATSQRGRERSESWKSVTFDIPSDDDLFWCVVDPTYESSLRGNYAEKINEALANSVERLQVPRDPSLADIIQAEFDESTLEAMQQIHHAIYEPSRYVAANPAHFVLGAVLSSDIDADKVSYLIEDSSRSGVNYGSGVDFDGLIGSLRMPALTDIESRPTLGITHKGLAAAQSVAINRNLMVGQVYWHHTNRAATAMVKYAIAGLLKRGGIWMPDYVRDTFFLEYEAALGYLHDKFNTIRRPNEINPIAGILEGERRIYKTAFSTARLESEEAEHIADHLVTGGIDQTLNLEDDLQDVVAAVPGIGATQKGEVLVDVPLKERQRPAGDRGGQVMVYRSREDTSGKRLREYSPFLRSVKDQHIRENRVCRVFIAPRLTEDETAYSRAIEAVNKHMRSLIH